MPLVAVELLDQVVDIALLNGFEAGVGWLDGEALGGVAFFTNVGADTGEHALEMGREAFAAEPLSGLGEDQHLFDNVFEFADVAREGIRAKGVDHLGLKIADFLVEGAAGAREEATGQQGDVGTAFAQGRELYGECFEAVKEVFAEAALVDIAAEVTMGGGDDAGIGRDLGIGPNGADGALLQCAQELGLQVEGEVADFVEKEAPPGGCLKEAGLFLVGTGKGTLLMAEEFALDQFGGDGRAVDRDEVFCGDAALGVDGLGGQFLTRATLTKQKDGLARCAWPSIVARGVPISWPMEPASSPIAASCSELRKRRFRRLSSRIF